MSRKVIKLQISPWYAANATKTVYFYAPSDWDDLSDQAKRDFEAEEIETFLNEHIETTFTAYDSVEDAVADNKNNWSIESHCSPGEIESPYD